ncbi:NHL repeat-containing protein [Geobacter sp. 60473]|nr:NHL repeat-containing protein [Geobacter sp. 60473]
MINHLCKHIETRMRQIGNRRVAPLAILAAVLMGGPTNASTGEFKVAYLYNLSDFTGTIPYSLAKIALDATARETYVISGETVKVFNNSGMEVYRFTNTMESGIVYDAAIDEQGRILVLAYNNGTPSLLLCNYRAEPIKPIEFKGLPEKLAAFKPNRLMLRDGKICLVSLGSMMIVTLDPEGNYVKHIDLAEASGTSDEDRLNMGIGAVAFDSDGSILFTTPVIGKVFRIAADGKVDSFGKRGSAPGKFGVPTGIAADGLGNYYISDKLRCAILVFDRQFKFIYEFGGRGDAPGSLVGPDDLAIDAEGKLYVGQLGKRGVSVFKVTHD